MWKITLSERVLLTKYHRLENTNRELENKIAEYRASLLTMKENITELKELNKILVKQISSLSSKLKQCPNSTPSMKDEM